MPPRGFKPATHWSEVQHTTSGLLRPPCSINRKPDLAKKYQTLSVYVMAYPWAWCSGPACLWQSSWPPPADSSGLWSPWSLLTACLSMTQDHLQNGQFSFHYTTFKQVGIDKKYHHSNKNIIFTYHFYYNETNLNNNHVCAMLKTCSTVWYKNTKA